MAPTSLLHAAAPVVDAASADGVFSLLWLVIALPALGAAVLLLGGRRTDPWGHWLGVGTVAGSFLLSLVMFFGLVGRDGEDRQVTQHLWTWFTAGKYTVGFDLLYDQLSAVFLLLITGVGGIIHLYSVGYMEHDERRRRFFGYLNLFVASMLGLVLAGDFVGVFLGWEGVGLASYLLIGFWQHKPTAAAAAKKAFVINRVGDIGLSLGGALIFVTFGSTSFAVVSANSDRASDGALTAIGLLLLLASIGYLAYDAVTEREEPPSPAIRITAIEPQGDRFLVRVQVVNRTRATASALRIEGELRRGSEVVERSETEFDYLPGKSSREGGLFFRADPRTLQLVLSARSYQAP